MDEEQGAFARAATAIGNFGDAVGAGIVQLAENAGFEMRILPKDGEKMLREKLISSGLYEKLRRRKRDEERRLDRIKTAGSKYGASEKVESEIWERAGRKFAQEGGGLNDDESVDGFSRGGMGTESGRADQHDVGNDAAFWLSGGLALANREQLLLAVVSRGDVGVNGGESVGVLRRRLAAWARVQAGKEGHAMRDAEKDWRIEQGEYAGVCAFGAPLPGEGSLGTWAGEEQTRTGTTVTSGGAGGDGGGGTMGSANPQPVWLLFGRRPISVHACSSAGSRAVVLTASGRMYSMGGGSAGGDDSAAGREMAAGAWLVGSDKAVATSSGARADRRFVLGDPVDPKVAPSAGAQEVGRAGIIGDGHTIAASGTPLGSSSGTMVPVGAMLPQAGFMRKKSAGSTGAGGGGGRRTSAAAFASQTMELAASMGSTVGGGSKSRSDAMAILDAATKGRTGKTPRDASAAMLLLREAALKFSRQDAREVVEATGAAGVLEARAVEWGEFDTGAARSWHLAGVPKEPSSALSDAAAARGIIISLALLRRRFLRRYELAGIDDLTAMRTAMGTTGGGSKSEGSSESKGKSQAARRHAAGMALRSALQGGSTSKRGSASMRSIGRSQRRPRGLLEHEAAWLEQQVEETASGAWDKVAAPPGWLGPLLHPLEKGFDAERKAAEEQMRIRSLMPRWMHATEAALALAIALEDVAPSQSQEPDGTVVYKMRGKLGGFESQKLRRAAFLLWTSLHVEVQRRVRYQKVIAARASRLAAFSSNGAAVATATALAARRHVAARSRQQRRGSTAAKALEALAGLRAKEQTGAFASAGGDSSGDGAYRHASRKGEGKRERGSPMGLALVRGGTAEGDSDETGSSSDSSEDTGDFEQVKLLDKPEVLAFAPGQGAQSSYAARATEAAEATGGARGRRASLVGAFGPKESRQRSRGPGKKESSRQAVSLFDEPEVGLEMLPCQYGPGPPPSVTRRPLPPSSSQTSPSKTADPSSSGPAQQSPTDFLRPRPPPQTRPRLVQSKQLRFRRVVQAAVGGDHFLCIDEDGTLLCGGADGSGQTGLAAAGSAGAARRTASRTGYSAQSVRHDVRPNHLLSQYTLTKRKVRSIAAGSVHSAAIGEEGGLWAWGLAGGGRLGVAPMAGPVESEEQLLGMTGTSQESRLARLKGERNGVDIYPAPTAVAPPMDGAAGDGSLFRPSQEDSAELDQASMQSLRDQSSILLVQDGWNIRPKLRFSMVSCGAAHTLACTDDGRLFSWGEGAGGRLGLGDERTQWTPAKVNIPEDWAAVSISCGLWHSAVVVQHRRAFRGFPQDLFKQQLESIPLRHEEASLTDEQAQKRLQWGLTLCMTAGIGGLGQLGRGRSVSRSLDFQPVPCLPRNVMAVACGANHVIAWTSYGCCYSWGQAGIAPAEERNASANRLLPGQVPQPDGAKRQTTASTTGSPSTSRNLVGRPPAPWEKQSELDSFGFFPGRVLAVAGGRHLPVVDAAAGRRFTLLSTASSAWADKLSRLIRRIQVKLRINPMDGVPGKQSSDRGGLSGSRSGGVALGGGQAAVSPESKRPKRGRRTSLLERARGVVSGARKLYAQGDHDDDGDPIGLQAATSRRAAGRGLRFLETSDFSLRSGTGATATSGASEQHDRYDEDSLLDAYSTLWDRWWSWRQEDVLVSALSAMLGDDQEDNEDSEGVAYEAGQYDTEANGVSWDVAGVSRGGIMTPGYRGFESGGIARDLGFEPSQDGRSSAEPALVGASEPLEEEKKEHQQGDAYQHLQRNRMQRGLPTLSSLQLGPNTRLPGHALSAREQEEQQQKIRVLTRKDRKRLQGHAEVALARTPSASKQRGLSPPGSDPVNRISLFDMLRAESSADDGGSGSAHTPRSGAVDARAALLAQLNAAGLGRPGAQQSGSLSARPGSTMGLRALLASQGAASQGDPSRPETAASRLAQALDQFSIRPGTTSSRGYGSVRQRQMQQQQDSGDLGASSSVLGANSRDGSAIGHSRSAIVSQSSRRRGTALLQFDVEGLLAEQASKAAYYHAEGRQGTSASSHGQGTSEVAVPEDAVATVTAAAADAAEGRFGASSGGQVAMAVNDGLRRHRAGGSSPTTKGVGRSKSAGGGRRVSVSAEGARRLMDTVVKKNSGAFPVAMRPRTSASRGRAGVQVHFGGLAVVPAVGEESESEGGLSSSSATDLGSESDASHGEEIDWEGQISAAVRGPGDEDSLGSSMAGGTGHVPPRTPSIRGPGALFPAPSYGNAGRGTGEPSFPVGERSTGGGYKISREGGATGASPAGNARIVGFPASGGSFDQPESEDGDQLVMENGGGAEIAANTEEPRDGDSGGEGDVHRFEFDDLDAPSPARESIVTPSETRRKRGIPAPPPRRPRKEAELLPIVVSGGVARSVRLAVKSILRDSIRVWRRREWWDSGHVPPEVEAEARLQAFAHATLRPKCGWPHAPGARPGASDVIARRRTGSPKSSASDRSGKSAGDEAVPDPCECPGFRARRREIGSPAPREGSSDLCAVCGHHKRFHSPELGFTATFLEIYKRLMHIRAFGDVYAQLPSPVLRNGQLHLARLWRGHVARRAFASCIVPSACKRVWHAMSGRWIYLRVRGAFAGRASIEPPSMLRHMPMLREHRAKTNEDDLGLVDYTLDRSVAARALRFSDKMHAIGLRALVPSPPDSRRWLERLRQVQEEVYVESEANNAAALLLRNPEWRERLAPIEEIASGAAGAAPSSGKGPWAHVVVGQPVDYSVVVEGPWTTPLVSRELRDSLTWRQMEQVADRLKRSWKRFEVWERRVNRVPRAVQYDGMVRDLLSTATPGGGKASVTIGNLASLQVEELGLLGTVCESVEAAAAVATGVGASGSGFITVDGFARVCSSFGISIAQPAFDPVERVFGSVAVSRVADESSGAAHDGSRHASQWSDAAGACMLAMALSRAERWSLQLPPAKDAIHCAFNVFGFAQPWVVVDDEQAVPGTHAAEEDSCLSSLCSGLANTVLTCGGCCGGLQARIGPTPPLDERQRDDPGAHLFASQLPPAGWGSGPQGGFAKTDCISLLRSRGYEASGTSSEEMASRAAEAAADGAVARCGRWLGLDLHGASGSAVGNDPIGQGNQEGVKYRAAANVVPPADVSTGPSATAWRSGKTAPQRLVALTEGLPDSMKMWLRLSVAAELLSSGLRPSGQVSSSSGKVSLLSTGAQPGVPVWQMQEQHHRGFSAYAAQGAASACGCFASLLSMCGIDTEDTSTGYSEVAKKSDGSIGLVWGDGDDDSGGAPPQYAPKAQKPAILRSGKGGGAAAPRVASRRVLVRPQAQSTGSLDEGRMWGRAAELGLVSPEIETLVSAFEAVWGGGRGPGALPPKWVQEGPAAAGEIPQSGPTAAELQEQQSIGVDSSGGSSAPNAKPKLTMLHCRISPFIVPALLTAMDWCATPAQTLAITEHLIDTTDRLDEIAAEATKTDETKGVHRVRPRRFSSSASGRSMASKPRVANESLLNSSMRRNAPVAGWVREDGSNKQEDDHDDGVDQLTLPEMSHGGLRATCGSPQEGEEHSLEAAVMWAEKGKAVSMAAFLAMFMAGGPVGQLHRTTRRPRSRYSAEGSAAVHLPASPLVFHLRRTRPLGQFRRRLRHPTFLRGLTSPVEGGVLLLRAYLADQERTRVIPTARAHFRQRGELRIRGIEAGGMTHATFSLGDGTAVQHSNAKVDPEPEDGSTGQTLPQTAGFMRGIGPIQRFQATFGRLAPKYEDSRGPTLRVAVRLGGGVAADAAAGRGMSSELASQSVSLAAQSCPGSAVLSAVVEDALLQTREGMWRAWDRESGRVARRQAVRTSSHSRSMTGFSSSMQMITMGSDGGGDAHTTASHKDLVDPCERDCEILSEPAFACAGCNRAFGLRRDWRRHVSSGTCTQPSDFGVVEEPYYFGDGSQAPVTGWRRLLRSGGVDLGVGPLGLRILRQAAALAHAAAGGGATIMGGAQAGGRHGKGLNEVATAAEAADAAAAAGGSGQWSLLSPSVLSVYLSRWAGEAFLLRAARQLVLTGRVAVPVPPGGDIDRRRLIRRFERWWKKNGPVHPAGVATRLRRQSQFAGEATADSQPGLKAALAAASDAAAAVATGAGDLEPRDPVAGGGLQSTRTQGLVKVMPRLTNRPWLVQTHPAASPVVPLPPSIGGPWLLPAMTESDRAQFQPGVLAMHLERQLRQSSRMVGAAAKTPARKPRGRRVSRTGGKGGLVMPHHLRDDSQDSNSSHSSSRSGSAGTNRRPRPPSRPRLSISEQRRKYRLSPRWLDKPVDGNDSDDSDAHSNASQHGRGTNGRSALESDSDIDSDDAAGGGSSAVARRARAVANQRKRTIRTAVQQIACARTQEQAVDALRVASRSALDRAGDWAESEEDEEDDEEALDVVGAMPMMLGVARPGTAEGSGVGRTTSSASVSRARSRGGRVGSRKSRQDTASSLLDVATALSSRNVHDGEAQPPPPRLPKVRRPSGRELTQKPNSVGSQLSSFLKQQKKADWLDKERSSRRSSRSGSDRED